MHKLKLGFLPSPSHCTAYGTSLQRSPIDLGCVWPSFFSTGADVAAGISRGATHANRYIFACKLAHFTLL